MFPRGTQSITLTGDYATPFLGDDDKYYSINGGYGYYLWDNFAIQGLIGGHIVDTLSHSNAVGGDFSIQIRWHLLQVDRWTFYIDGGPGVGYWDHVISSPTGTNFNFVLRGGIGATYKLCDNTHLMFGANYQHLSNSGIQGPNHHPASNDVAFYAGLLWTF